MNHNQQSSNPLSQALNQANAIDLSSVPPEISELSLAQIWERAMQVARELQSSRQVQQASGQHDPLHLQSQIQNLRMLQARAMQLQREQTQSRPASQAAQAPQAPLTPNMQMGRMQQNREPMQQQQMRAQAMQNRSAPPIAQMAQMQRQIQQQMQNQQVQTRSAPPMLYTPRHSLNLNTINQLSNQSHGLYMPVQPDSFKLGQPDPPPQYTPPVRPQSQVPGYNMAPHAQSSPLKPPFPLAQSSESNVGKSSTGLSVSDVRVPTSLNTVS